MNASAPERESLTLSAASPPMPWVMNQDRASRKHQHYSGVFSVGLHFATRDIVFFISNDIAADASFIQAILLVSSLSRTSESYAAPPTTRTAIEHQVEPKEQLKRSRNRQFLAHTSARTLPLRRGPGAVGDAIW